MCLQAVEGAFLIRAHQPRIARHIGGEDGGEAPGSGHVRSIFFREPR